MRKSGGNRRNRQDGRPTVTIIIVTFNAGNYLQACIDSITSQTFQNIELLIFDGVSTDNTLDIIRQNADHISFWQSEPDVGIYDAMNKAVKHATGKWILFLGADDELLHGFSQASAHLKKEDTLYYGHCYRKEIKTNSKLSAYEIAKVNVCHHAVFYPTRIFNKYNYKTEYVVYADHALNIQLWGDKSIYKRYLPYAIAKYSPDGFSTRTKDEVFRETKLDWIKKYMSGYVYFRYAIRKWKEKKKKKNDFF
jgi:glycosyltransferase involved in cell wall biosynthesis